MKSFIEGSANAAGFMLCTIFVAYVAAIVVPLLRHRRGIPGDASKFDWHFLIPCLNEERVITPTVNDLFKKFPGAHIWCIDDGSTDSTLRIVSRMAAVGKLRAGGSTRRTQAAARSERVPLTARGHRGAPVVGGRLKVGPPLVPAVVRSGSDSSGPVDRTTFPE